MATTYPQQPDISGYETVTTAVCICGEQYDPRALSDCPSCGIPGPFAVAARA